MLTWRIEALHLKLRYSSRGMRSAGKEKINFLVQVSDGSFNGFGEAAPDIRQGDTAELLLKQYKVLLLAGLAQVHSMEELLQLLEQHPPINSLRFAIESAYLHYFCQHKTIPVYQLLGQALPKPQPTGFTLPALEPGEVDSFIQEHELDRFQYLRVQVNQKQAQPLVWEVLEATDKPVVIDGNENWHSADELSFFLNSLDRERILFVEQPMPATKVAAYAQVKPGSPVPLIAKNAVTDEVGFELLRTQFHGINIDMMQAGGYLNTIRLLQLAQKNNLFSIISCSGETTLSTWSALQLSNAFDLACLDSFLILEEEPFSLVKEQSGVLYL